MEWGCVASTVVGQITDISFVPGPVGADLSAKQLSKSSLMYRLKYRIRGQVRSHGIFFKRLSVPGNQARAPRPGFLNFPEASPVSI